MSLAKQPLLCSHGIYSPLTHPNGPGYNFAVYGDGIRKRDVAFIGLSLC